MSLSKHRHNNTLLHQQHRRHDQPGAASMSAASGPPTPAAAAAAPLPCCCYEEARSPQCGRHLVAARDLPPGQVVIAHAPFAAVLLDDQVSARCDFCFAPPASQPLMRCARSKLAHYDSQAHQRAAWRAYYKHECAALVDCAPRVPPASVRLAARVLWRRARKLEQAQGGDQQQQQPEVAGSRYADVEALLSHWQELPGSRKVQYAQMAVLTRQFMLGEAHLQAEAPQPAADTLAADTSAATPAAGSGAPDVKAIAALLARFGCNNHTVCDEELRPIGVGLYPLGALVNHSCRPNCAQSFQGPNIVFRSLRAIPAGEQLTISYVELAATRQERRRQLLQQYFFDIDGLTAAAADPGQVGGVVQLQLVCRLPELHATCQLPVTCHSTSTSPPWPTDAADKQLCQMLVLPPTGKQGEPLQLPGGMCLLPVLPPASSGDQDAAAALFQDLDLDAQASTQVDAAGRSDDDADAGSGSQQLEAVQWGDWGAATSSSSISSVQEAATSELAVAAAGVLMAVHSLQQQADRAVAQGDASAAVRLYQRALAVADAAAPGLAVHHAAAATDADAAASSSTSSSSRGWRVQLGPRHVLRARVTAGLLKAAVDASEWQVALRAARALVPVYELVYPQVWPNLGLHYALLAKLEMFLEHPAAAVQAAEAAARTLQVTHGPGSSVVQEVMRIRYEAGQELAAAAADARV